MNLELGSHHVFGAVEIFFGNRAATESSIQNAYPQLKLALLQQTHSNVVVSYPGTGPADAHLTKEKSVALAVRTADCLPVLFFDPRSERIAAAHAGWRGIENGILLETARALKNAGAQLSGTSVWIGPHIGPDSFVVDLDVAERLQAAFQSTKVVDPMGPVRIDAHSQEPQKATVDLMLIARAQLFSMGVRSENIADFSIDTVTSLQHASHRRDRENAGRQISWIALRR